MYGLLVIRFRSFYQPLLIYVTIPLSFAGSFLSIILSGAPLTFIGLLGLTGLTGIVINDGILLIDTANQLIKHGHTVTYATIKAAKSRFFPVVLTSVTTIIGLIPLLVTQNMFQQLALAFVFGLFSSTVFLLLIIPVLYQGGYLIGVVKSQPHTAR
jgi:multidrug efflux pump subunit AcrB